MIRNFLFSFSFFSGIVFISIIFLPSLLLPQKITLLGGKLMGYWSQYCLKIILSTNIVIKGKPINNRLIINEDLKIFLTKWNFGNGSKITISLA